VRHIHIVRTAGLGLLLALVLAISTIVIAQEEAQATSVYGCTGGNTSSQSWHTGSNTRWTTNNGNSSIVWSFYTSTGCPNSLLPGGANQNLGMKVQFCSGGGGQSYTRTFTSVAAKNIATHVLPHTCFKVMWRPNNAATDHESFHGKLLWEL
jgi:hypothetical protein